MKRIAILLCAGAAATASAQVVTGYDILDAAESGFGGWAHFYNGTITNTGSDSANGFAFDRADYSGGGGTLNDGAIGTGAGDTQLFGNTSATRPRITVHLDGIYDVDDITLFSFDGGNTIPGRIRGLDVTINNVTESFLTSEPGNPGDEFIDLVGSTLDGLPASSITFSNFLHDGGNSLDQMFAISEIGVRGTLIPAPGALALLGASGLALTRRRR